MESFRKVYNSFDDFDDETEFNKQDLFTCGYCAEENNENEKQMLYIAYLEQKES